ncbi:PREDICTED: serine/threonine-protein kinase 33-like [Nicrophorus vespilloides]|uniref:Serine/threonine-protein kinase 33-like n=1 Tax=Nicrophorus vespilloides TaxID=110193 RepID=A0ABM1N2X3_NICVS|nr:PREDICTED: serine/threonine-protein kinase 33-like [Nicrophorus vespilloides]
MLIERWCEWSNVARRRRVAVSITRRTVDVRKKKMQNPLMINAGINTESLITGYGARVSRRASAKRSPLRVTPLSLLQRSITSSRYVKHIKIDDDEVVSQIYNCGDLLGSGTFGKVYQVRDNKNSHVWAMKVVHKQALSSGLMKAFEREVQIMKMVQHPHIIYLHEIYETSKKIYLITEKCYTDLMKLFVGGRKFPESETRRITNDLSGAVAYLHKINIVHRDIKMDNVLVTTNPDDENDNMFIKLTDFGLSIVKTGRTHTDMLHDRCGTFVYMAPEVLLHQSYSQQCDVWAIGVIMYALLAGRMPFDPNDNDVMKSICHGTINIDALHASNACKDLLDKILEKNPAVRITAIEILSHPWFIGETTMQKTTYSNNIIEMMRQCNDDLKVKQNKSKQLDQSEIVGVKADMKKNKKEVNWNHRKSVPVTVQNIEFDKQLQGKRKTDSGNKQSAASKGGVGGAAAGGGTGTIGAVLQQQQKGNHEGTTGKTEKMNNGPKQVEQRG